MLDMKHRVRPGPAIAGREALRPGRQLLGHALLAAGLSMALADAAAAQRVAAASSLLHAPLGDAITLAPPMHASAEPVVRPDPPALEAPPMRPATAPRLDRQLPVAPSLTPAERPPPTRELAQLRRAAEPRSGFGSTRAAAQAAWTLGLLHLHGAGVTASPALAQTWFQRALPQGREPLAYAGLAWCLIDGCQGPPDPAGARQAIDRLRARDPARALYLEWLLNTRLKPLALSVEAPLAQGDTLPMAPLLRRAAAGGNAQARLELGIDAYQRGDLNAARQYFQSASSRSAAAAANLRWLGQSRTPPGPLRGSGEGDGDAGQMLARARQFHRGDGVPANYAEALRLYQLAAARGSDTARRMVELIFSRPAPGGSVDIAWIAQLSRLDTRSSLPQLATRQAAPWMQRDATPLYDLVPPDWRQRIGPARPV